MVRIYAIILHNSNYSLDMSSVLINSLCEEYLNQEPRSDGEVVRQIRFCQQQGKIFQEMKW